MFPFELEGTKMRPDIALKTLLRRIRKNMLEEFCETQDFRRKKRTKGPLYLEQAVEAYLDLKMPQMPSNTKEDAVFALCAIFYNKNAAVIYPRRKAQVE